MLDHVPKGLNPGGARNITVLGNSNSKVRAMHESQYVSFPFFNRDKGINVPQQVHKHDLYARYSNTPKDAYRGPLRRPCLSRHIQSSKQPSRKAIFAHSRCAISQQTQFQRDELTHILKLEYHRRQWNDHGDLTLSAHCMTDNHPPCRRLSTPLSKGE